MHTKISCCLLLFAILFSISGFAQDETNAPLSTISLSVVTPDENAGEGISPVQLTRLKTRVVSLVTQNGLSADGSNDGFVIYPVFQIYDWQQSQSTMRAIVVANCSFSLYIKQVVQGSKSNIIFSSFNTQIQGTGYSKDEAISNALQQIKPGDSRIQDFFVKAKNRIVSYYVQNCDKITRAAENAANIEDYGKSFSLLLSIPTEAKACNEEVQQKLVVFYLKKQKKDCGKYIVAAKTFAANMEFDSALMQLRKVDPESVCKEDLWNTINDVESKAGAQKKAEWELLKETLRSSVELEKARINSANEWAKTWMTDMGRKQYRVERGSGSDLVITEEAPSGFYSDGGAKNNKKTSRDFPLNASPGGDRNDKNDKSSSELLANTTFTPYVLFENNIFPSFIISRYSYTNPETIRQYGDISSCIGINVLNKNAGGTLYFEIIPTEDKYFTAVKGSVTFTQNESKKFFPEIPWKYDALRNIQQSTPLSVTFRLYDNNGKVKEAIVKINFRSIRECITGFMIDGKPQTTQLLAAYVNEENPQIDKLLKEGLEKNWVDAWVGYQENEEAVFKQVKAVWKIVSSKGIKYSDITSSASNVSNTFFSQPVRSFCQSIYNKQANCVDGTLVFASILKNIGLRPALILVPGHCFLAYHKTSTGSDDYEFLETTLIGNYSGKPTEEMVEKNFLAAIKYGEKTFSETDKNKMHIIEVEAARQQNTKPINLSDDYCK